MGIEMADENEIVVLFIALWPEKPLCLLQNPICHMYQKLSEI